MKQQQKTLFIVFSALILVASLVILIIWGFPAWQTPIYSGSMAWQPADNQDFVAPHQAIATDAAATQVVLPTDAAPLATSVAVAAVPVDVPTAFAAFLEQANQMRSQQGLSPLTAHADLTTFAQSDVQGQTVDTAMALDVYNNGCALSVRVFNGGADPNAFDAALNGMLSEPDLMNPDMLDIGMAQTEQNGGIVYSVWLGTPYVLNSPRTAYDRVGDTSNAGQEQAIVELLNLARADAGLSPLSINATLTGAALSHSQDQAQQDVLSHDGSDGSTPSDRVQRAGYAMRTVRENVLGRGNTHASCAFDMWWNSQGHYENMMADDVTEIGIAYAPSATGLFYYTMVLASPQN